MTDDMDFSIDRASRDAGLRQPRQQSWAAPSLLPDPNPEPGFSFRWIRLATLAVADPTNPSRQFREGWVPVKAEDHPELQGLTDASVRFQGGVEVGGLLLCKIPSEVLRQRAAHYSNIASQQMVAVDNDYMREHSAAFPHFRERSSKTTFGRG